MYQNNRQLILALLVLLLHSGIVHALPEDSKEKVYVKADKSTYNLKTHFNVFEGHVKVDQGSTHILADKLTTKSNDQFKIIEAIAYGTAQPAHYWTIPKQGDQELHTYAEIIKFYPIQSNVVFEKNVTLKQGENSFQGQLILYNMRDLTVTVPESNNSRSVLVYNPDN